MYVCMYVCVCVINRLLCVCLHTYIFFLIFFKLINVCMYVCVNNRLWPWKEESRFQYPHLT